MTCSLWLPAHIQRCSLRAYPNIMASEYHGSDNILAGILAHSRYQAWPARPVTPTHSSFVTPSESVYGPADVSIAREYHAPR
jgi:hypothetical protein